MIYRDTGSSGYEGYKGMYGDIQDRPIVVCLASWLLWGGLVGDTYGSTRGYTGSSYSGIHRYIRTDTGIYGDIRAQVHIKGYMGIYRAQPDIRRYRDKRDSPSQPPWSHMAAEPPWVHPWLPRCPLAAMGYTGRSTGLTRRYGVIYGVA